MPQWELHVRPCDSSPRCGTLAYWDSLTGIGGGLFSAVRDRDDGISIEGLHAEVDSRLADLIAPGSGAPARLGQSMRHSLLAPGKRVRALIAMLAAAHHGAPALAALDAACAVELVHSASLVLDDLPAMDDSRLRRGLPANHCVYGEGTAILAAIGLMNRAFGVVAEDGGLGPGQRLAIVRVLSWSIGADGLIAGQEQDLNASGELDSVAAIEQMHGRKTGALFAAAAEIGAVVADAGAAEQALARRFGWQLGIAFQTFDDLVDRFASSGAALKDTGKDLAKPTLVALLGPERALAAARRNLDDALGALAGPWPPSALTRYVGDLREGLLVRLGGRNLELADGASRH